MRLDPEDIELIAERVTERLRRDPPAQAVRFADASTVARQLGVDRDWVYGHARELGAIRLGGPRGRLRFDLRQIEHELAAPAPPARARPRQRPNARRGAMKKVDLLPYAEVCSTPARSGRAARERPRP